MTDSAFIVVVNDIGQHALWEAELDLPAGWRRQSAPLPRRACLDAIAGAWPDVAPATVRAATAGERYAAGSARDDQRRHPVPDGHDARFVHELFAEQAARRPDATAVIAAGTRLTYRELDQSANRLARYLQDLGAGPETLIGVYSERGVEAVRSLLAIMKAGSGYLPLDPSLPAERLARICAAAKPMTVITGRSVKKSSSIAAGVLVISELAADLERQPSTPPEVSLHPDNLCYVIHTSGSTGDPKAVAISHGGLADVITDLAGEYEMSARDRVVQLASLAFDTSVEQMLVALTTGATLMLPPAGTIAPTDLLRYLKQQRVTVVDLTPAYWHQLLAVTEPDDERLRTLRLMITGGDMADPADCRAALRAVPGARLLNAYGLTETTITSALFDVSAARVGPPGTPVPVGRAVAHARIMVLDEKLSPVPAGEAGEVYVGGPGVARGYLGQPALTAEVFLPDRGGLPGSRMYRTGDLGRRLPDGALEVAGRVDRQLKVRGFRVEPSEIESVLAGHPDIGQVAVVATRHGTSDTRLAAYYTRRDGAASDGAGSDGAGSDGAGSDGAGSDGAGSDGAASDGAASDGLSAAGLRRFLRGRLPSYMIPTAFVALDQMPLNPADEPALEEARVPARRRGPAERRTPTQAGLSHLWSKLVKQEQIGLDDDFFALGGNSLLAAEMLAHARVMFGISADYVRPLTRCLLRDPTLREFAKATEEARAGRLAADGDQTPIDFAREAEFSPPNRLRADPQYGRPNFRRPLEILLTGSTGFFGAHLLHELLATTNARVWCLVRARDASHALERVAGAAARFELPDLPSGRVVPLPGDLAAPRLGLSLGEFHGLARSIDIIYHAGASVNFIYPYEELRAANVTSVREVIRLATMARVIPVHYVSSTAVLAGLGVMGVREVTEDTPLAYADRLRIGYVETKYVAEELLRNAGRAGLPVAIYRPLDIVGSRRTGVWSTSTEMCALIRFITDTGLAPAIDLPLDFVPADVCAAAVRHISSLEEATGRTYHLASPEYTLLGSLVDRLRAYGFEVREVPFAAWVSELVRYAANHPSHPMTTFLPLFIDRDQETGLTPAEMYFEHVFPHYSRTNTERALSGSGIAFTSVDAPLLDANIGRLISVGYLKASRDNLLPGQLPAQLPDQRERSQVPNRSAHAG